jgi:hypothetical protein
MFGSYVIDSSGFLGIIDRRGAICQARAMARSEAEEVSAVLSASVLIQTEAGRSPISPVSPRRSATYRPELMRVD